jgi:hypothetical protein
LPTAELRALIRAIRPFAILAGLIYAGIQPIHLLPIAVALLAISSVIGAPPESLAAATVGLLVGSGLGWSLEPRDATRRLPSGRLWQRREWLTLVQIALTLSVRYVTNDVAAMAPVLGANPIWHVSSFLVTALLSGVFLGRVAAKLRIYLVMPARSQAQSSEPGR